MAANYDPLTYRWKRTMIEAFGTDSSESTVIETHKIRPRYAKLAAEIFSLVYICVVLAYVVFK